MAKKKTRTAAIETREAIANPTGFAGLSFSFQVFGLCSSCG